MKSRSNLSLVAATLMYALAATSTAMRAAGPKPPKLCTAEPPPRLVPQITVDQLPGERRNLYNWQRKSQVLIKNL